jgi:hypothetical protein
MSVLMCVLVLSTIPGGGNKQAINSEVPCIPQDPTMIYIGGFSNIFEYSSSRIFETSPGLG